MSPAGRKTMAEAEDRQARVAALTAAFEAVDEEMRGLPVYNPALSVEAVGFRAYEGHWIGAVITPWFMGVVALHPDPAGWRDLSLAAKESWSFPSGDYEFMMGEVAAEEGDALRYQSLSLFSPMGEFDGQEAAREAAEGALKALFMPAEEISRLAESARKAESDAVPPEIARRDRQGG